LTNKIVNFVPPILGGSFSKWFMVAWAAKPGSSCIWNLRFKHRSSIQARSYEIWVQTRTC